MKHTFICLLVLLLHQVLSVKVLHRSSDKSEGSTGSLPEEQQQYIEEQYQLFMENRRKEKEAEEEANKLRPPPEGITPSKLGMKRDNIDAKVQNLVELTNQVPITGGTFWFGSQTDIKNKIAPWKSVDGSQKRKKVSVKDFSIDQDCVSNEQFKDFVDFTNYVTEAELYGWSFVLEIEASKKVIEQADGPTGYGRVKTATHWMAVPGADWKHPYGPDSTYPSSNTADSLSDSDSTTATHTTAYPVVHISYKDATEYCLWAGRRLPTDIEWEYACRGGLVNNTYPWVGDIYKPDSTTDTDTAKPNNGHRMNVWQGKFPKTNTRLDGYLGISPLYSFAPQNAYQVYNMLGNVWEWVVGGNKDKRISRGGSYIDSVDGKFNHPVLVSTKNHNSGDSTSSTSGFRCVSQLSAEKNKEKTSKTDKKDPKINSNTKKDSKSSSSTKASNKQHMHTDEDMLEL